MRNEKAAAVWGGGRRSDILREENTIPTVPNLLEEKFTDSVESLVNSASQSSKKQTCLSLQSGKISSVGLEPRGRKPAVRKPSESQEELS